MSGPQIIKTFLVVNSPGQSDNDTFTFVHIYKTKNPRGDVVKRISRGALIGFDDVFCFFGASARSLNDTMDKAKGLKVVSLPITSFTYEQRLLGGVFLSTSLHWQPIVGRIALVHIGFKSTLGAGLSDNDIQLGALNTKDELVNDLKSFGGGQSKSDRELSEIAEFVRRQINNKPFVDHTSEIPEIFRSLATENVDTREGD